MTAAAKIIDLAPVTNDGASTIESQLPYVADITIVGTTAFLFHRWSVDGVEAKAKAAKGSKAKKEDDLESYVYRCDDGTLGIPGEYLRMAAIGAAKYRQDPRSPRKSAMDLYKAGVVSLTDVATVGKKDWDYLDRRRVTVQRNGITRVRPALREWRVDFQFQVLTPEYITETDFLEVLNTAGRLIGIGDFRPTFGRFQVASFAISQ
ncbi:MAG: hypothetical protein WAU60_15955, partial [Candidatus Competibacter denitrificans]|jgi:hypothetical protein